MAFLNHGGDVYGVARRRGVPVSCILDFSANINPLGLTTKTLRRLERELPLVRHYPDKQQAELRRLVASKEKVDPTCILFGNGTTQLLHLIARCLKPRKALTIEPGFSEYRAALRCSGCKIREFRLLSETGFRFEINDFLQTLKREQPALIILGNPNNPTGALARRSALAKLVALCVKRRIHLVLDESFIDFTAQPSLAASAARQPYLIVVRSLTKFFALAGLRIGYLLAETSLVKKLAGSLEPWSVNTLALAAAAEAIKDSAYRHRSLALIRKEREFLAAGLAKLGWLEVFPSEANFLLVRIRAANISSSELQQRLELKNILIRDAGDFPGLGPQYFRLAIRDRNDNRILLKELNAVGCSLNGGRRR